MSTIESEIVKKQTDTKTDKELEIICPICITEIIECNDMHSCQNCRNIYCQDCYNNILSTSTLNKSCPFCRKPFIEFSNPTTTESLENTNTLDILDQIALDFFMEDDSFIFHSRAESSFASIIHFSYLLGTSIYLLRQIFSRTQRRRN